MTVHDAMLCALLDGEVAPDERRLVKAVLGEDREARERLGALARADVAIVTAASDIDQTPLPTSVARIVKAGRDELGAEAKQYRTADPVLRAGWWRAPLIAAASLMLGLVVGGNLLAGWRGAGSVGAIADVLNPGDPLYGALEYGPSGLERELGGGLLVTPVLTAASEDGWCREALITSTRASVTRVLACRRAGAWRVDAAAVEPPPSNDFTPAAREGAFEAFVAGRRLETPLSALEERALIRGEWRRPQAP